MNKKIIFVLLAVIMILTYFSFWGGKKKDNQVLSNAQGSASPSLAPTAIPLPADKLEVVHFHATQQCWSCITVGEYSLKTIKEKFPEEYASGRIVFKDINGELKENQEIVMKYRAKGSSLFVNAIRGDADDISEDITVWRLVNNENQFTNYFEGKLKSLLGK